MGGGRLVVRIYNNSIIIMVIKHTGEDKRLQSISSPTIPLSHSTFVGVFNISQQQHLLSNKLVSIFFLLFFSFFFP